MTLLRTAPTLNLNDPLADTAWKIYYEMFAPLAHRAVQRHLMTRAEFDAMMTDERIDKMLLFDDRNQLVGVGTVTTILDAVTLISAAYFEHNYPALYDAHAIFYVPFLAIGPTADWALFELVAEVYRRSAPVHGLVGMDMCDANERVARIITVMTKRLSSGASRSQCLDKQSYWFHNVNPRMEHDS